MKKLRFIVILFSSLSFVYISCNNDDNNNDIQPELKPLTVTEKSVVASNNNFAYELFREINNQDTSENIFISPLSIGMALAMTYNGADGETKEEMGNVLGFENVEDSSLNIAYEGVYDALMVADKQVEISLANSIWYTDELTIFQPFSGIIQDYYNGIISPIDLSNPDAAKDIINGWVEDNTKGKIKNLIKRIKITDVMFLVNAIYFNADWTYQFEKDKTEEADFYKENGSVVKCQLMQVEDIQIKKNYNNDYLLIELPYENQQFSMVLILPHEDKTTDDIIALINAEDINQILEETSTSETTLFMPKFKLEYEVNLNEVLKALGMPKAFGFSAEFPYLFEDVSEELFIDRVLHKAFIEVDEEGTEAAAATAVVIGKLSMSGIILNRPFIYLIRENHTGTVLFMGKLTDPS